MPNELAEALQEAILAGQEKPWIIVAAIITGIIVIIVTIFAIMTTGTEPKPPSEVGK